MGQTNDKSTSRNGRASVRARATRFDSSVFVNYELDTKQSAECKNWDMAGDSLWLEVAGLCDDGYSFTIKFDAYSDAYGCFIQVRGEPDHPNAGFILTGRGSTAEKAVKQAIFKHRSIGGLWSEYGERRRAVIDD